MEPQSRRRVLAQVDSRTHEAGWFTKDELPRELREGAARRLGILGLLTACTFVLFFLLNIPAGVQVGSPPLAPILVSTCAILISLLIFGISRKLVTDPRLLLNLGVVYQIMMALIIGIMNHLVPGEEVTSLGGAWSGVAVWIIIFAVFVPNMPARTLWVSSVVALMDPLALLAIVAFGNPMPPLTMLPQIFGPTVVAVATAVIAARINYRIGKRLRDVQEMGSYQLAELLGKGGMGEVWRAEHKMLARPAAIKLIRPDALAGGEGDSAQNLVRRFEREAQATALLQSEHTVELYDFGVSTDGTFYYVMELLDGLDLELLVKRFGPVPPKRAVHLLLQICDSLAEAHESGLIHRDIKPSNIYVCRRALRYDVVKVLDFGLVKSAPGLPDSLATLTAAGSISGTPAYMVPEIIEGAAQIDGRADLYSVGCVAYWLVTGKLVFEAESAMKMVVSHASAEPARLSERADQEIPPGLEEVVHACLEKDPAQRPSTARELSKRLAGLDLAAAWSEEDARRWWQKQMERPREDDPVDPLAMTEAPG